MKKKKQIKIIPRISLTEDSQKIYLIDDWKTIKVKPIKDTDYFEINKTIWALHINDELLQIAEWYNKWTKRYYEIRNHTWWYTIKNYYVVWKKREETFSCVYASWVEQYRLRLLNILWRLVYTHPCMRYVGKDWYTQYDLLSDLFLVADSIMTTIEFDTKTKIWKIFYLTHFHNACGKIKRDYTSNRIEYWLELFNFKDEIWE